MLKECCSTADWRLARLSMLSALGGVFVLEKEQCTIEARGLLAPRCYGGAWAVDVGSSCLRRLCNEGEGGLD